MSTKTLKIVELRAENIKGIKAIELAPSTNFVELAGKNGQGKSSVLDAVWLALGGREASKEIKTALKNGTDKGFVELNLGSLLVRRNFTLKDDDAITTSLKVEMVTDGIKSQISQPQSTLDALRAVTLDPAGFIALDPRAQRDQLLGLLDLEIDLDAHAAERKAAYDKRTDIGREIKALGDIAPVDEELPKKEQSASELLDKINAAEASNRNLTYLKDHAQRASDHLEAARKELAEAEAEFKKAEAALDAAAAPIDVSGLRDQLAMVEETNAAIRANNQRRDAHEQQSELRAAYETQTKRIEVLDAQKDNALAAAEVPVEGLSISEDGLTVDGVPFSDVNPGHQMRAALRIIAALEPRLRIIQVRQGSLIDADGRAEIEAFAAEHDYQIWFETVGDGGPDAIIINAGEVAA